MTLSTTGRRRSPPWLTRKLKIKLVGATGDQDALTAAAYITRLITPPGSP